MLSSTLLFPTSRNLFYVLINWLQWMLLLLPLVMGQEDLEALTSESNVLTAPETFNWFCLSQHRSGLLFDSQLQSAGCQVECMFLQKKGNLYFDSYTRFVHNLQDGVYCGRQHVCKSGQCVQDNLVGGVHKVGFVVVEILNAVLPNKDLLGATDAYVKVYTIETITEKNKIVKTKIGHTPTINNNNQPVFNLTYKSSKVSQDSYLMFKIYDQDQLDNDDFIATLYMPIKKSASMTENEISKMSFGSSDQYFLNVRISWIDSS